MNDIVAQDGTINMNYNLASWFKALWENVTLILPKFVRNFVYLLAIKPTVLNLNHKISELERTLEIKFNWCPNKNISTLMDLKSGHPASASGNGSLLRATEITYVGLTLNSFSSCKFHLLVLVLPFGTTQRKCESFVRSNWSDISAELLRCPSFIPPPPSSQSGLLTPSSPSLVPSASYPLMWSWDHSPFWWKIVYFGLYSDAISFFSGGRYQFSSGVLWTPSFEYSSMGFFSWPARIWLDWNLGTVFKGIS